MTFLLNHEKVLECCLIRISPDRNHLAVVERLEDGEAEQVSVFKLDTDKRVKTITMDTNMIAARTIVNVDFSADSKMLMLQCGEPDYMLLLYRWFSGKVSPCGDAWRGALRISTCAMLREWSTAGLTLDVGSGEHLWGWQARLHIGIGRQEPLARTAARGLLGLGAGDRGWNGVWIA